MPELPEVHTTATMLKKLVIGLTITDVWTDYGSVHHAGKDNIKDGKFFAEFKKALIGARIVKTHRRGKNVLIDVEKDGKDGERSVSEKNTIIIHMKMTGHVLYGTYERVGAKKKTSAFRPSDSGTWQAVSPEILKDPFNQFLHLVFSLSNGKHVALSDMRKFAKVTIVPTATLHESVHLADIGPEPLEAGFTFERFRACLATRPKGPIKLVLMDPKVLAGIGNIYSDEILWASGVHPQSVTGNIPEKILRTIYAKAKEILRKGIDFGGDSTSDYRNPLGERGEFHYHHHAYKNTGKVCEGPGCEKSRGGKNASKSGTIRRIKMGGRSAHFCDRHQKEF